MVLYKVPCSIWFSGACRHWSWWVPWLCCHRRCWPGCTASEKCVTSVLLSEQNLNCQLTLWSASNSTNTNTPLDTANWTKADPRQRAYNHMCRMLELLCNAGFSCSWMNSVWKPFVSMKQRERSPALWPLYCALPPGWGSLPAWSASHESSWSGQCADDETVKSGEQAGDNQYAFHIQDLWKFSTYSGMRVNIYRVGKKVWSIQGELLQLFCDMP